MDWKDKLKLGGQDAERKAIEEHWPKVQQLFHEKVGPAALAAAKDDHAMEILFKVVYAALPLPVPSRSIASLFDRGGCLTCNRRGRHAAFPSVS